MVILVFGPEEIHTLGRIEHGWCVVGVVRQEGGLRMLMRGILLVVVQIAVEGKGEQNRVSCRDVLQTFDASWTRLLARTCMVDVEIFEHNV